MKKIILFLLLSLICIICKGQGMNIWANDGVPQYIYVGSLMKDRNSTSNREKLKVEIFGGDYGSQYVGSTTYRIGTRYYYTINKEVHGGANAENIRYKLRIFDNGNKLDVVVETVSWAALIIKSWILDSNPIAHEVQCIRYDITGKNDITDQFSKTIFLSSDIKGNIGIGTDNPQSKLDVQGKIIADEVEIKVNKGADFVFESDYNLPTLSEVENHIKENKHLLDIPSEKEMIENGVNVNEMQIKLLQKIEELTLYIIELDKKDKEKTKLIERQEKLIQELQSIINE